MSQSSLGKFHVSASVVFAFVQGVTGVISDDGKEVFVRGRLDETCALATVVGCGLSVWVVSFDHVRIRGHPRLNLIGTMEELCVRLASNFGSAPVP